MYVGRLAFDVALPQSLNKSRYHASSVEPPRFGPMNLFGVDGYPRGHIKGPWTEEEDKQLVRLVAQYGAKRWSYIATFLSGRIGKQCRERYLNHLDPSLNKETWSPEEDQVIYRAHLMLGIVLRVASCLAQRQPMSRHGRNPACYPHLVPL